MSCLPLSVSAGCVEKGTPICRSLERFFVVFGQNVPWFPSRRSVFRRLLTVPEWITGLVMLNSGPQQQVKVPYVLGLD